MSKPRLANRTTAVRPSADLVFRRISARRPPDEVFAGYSERRAEAHFGTAERIVFAPLPCWAHLEPAAYRGKIAELIKKIVQDARRNRASRGVLGKRKILAQDPHDKPLASDRSPAPLVHAATRAVRTMLRCDYYDFVAAFRQAAARLRRGDRLVRFPPGAFPPPMPCILHSG